MIGPRTEYLLRLGDSALVLGQRLSEWCGMAPALEEDIAMANIGLDLIGQAQLWLTYAGECEGRGRNADDLAFRRDVWDFRNLLLTEQPNGDFGQTIMRQFLFDAFHVLQLEGLSRSSDHRIAEIAQKSHKETLYHLERSQETVIALGDGTDESHTRMQAALDHLWPYTSEMFKADDIDQSMRANGTAPDLETLQERWRDIVLSAFHQGMLKAPQTGPGQHGGKTGRRHSEHLGHMLAVMQFLPRAYPDARW